MRLVTAATADSSVSGSKFAMYCAERDSASHMRLPHADVVGEEDHVELAALGGARDLDVMREIDPGVGLRALMPPGGDMMAGRIEKGAEPELAFLPGHGALLPAHRDERAVRRIGIDPA